MPTKKRAKTAAKGATRKRAAQPRSAPRKTAAKWSARVMETSDAMDLEKGVFTRGSPRQVALSLKRSVEASHRRKSPPFRSAMSMLNFEINRGGKNLTSQRRHVLNQAKEELRILFHRAPA